MSGADIRAGRLRPRGLRGNFDDLYPPLDRKQALVEASRCYFCYDAPCIEACPTGIDIPSFIRGIQTDNVKGAAIDDPRRQHHGRRLRPGLPDRDPLRGCLRAHRAGGQAGQDRPAAALRHRLAVRPRHPAVHPGARHRQAGRRRRRRAGRPVLRPWAGAARPRGRRARAARQGRRPQRVRHRRLQGDRTTSRSARSTSSSASAASSCARRRARPRRPSGRSAPRATTPCSSASASAASTRWASPGEDLEGVIDAVDYIEAPAPGARTRRACRSAATWW